jgi:hypothetical protein
LEAKSFAVDRRQLTRAFSQPTKHLRVSGVWNLGGLRRLSMDVAAPGRSKNGDHFK